VILFWELQKLKALPCNSYYSSTEGFFFVAERDEISNLELIRDLDRIIKLEEVL
jgi:hypothetical protein